VLPVVEDAVFDINVFRSCADCAWDFLPATARQPRKREAVWAAASQYPAPFRVTVHKFKTSLTRL
jgi:hypothetical protein